MTALPAKYAYLRQDPAAPLLVQKALEHYGLKETLGAADNPVILSWADEVAAATKSAYADWAADFCNDDAIPWCGLAMAVWAVRASQGRPERLPEHKYLSAAEWLNYGVPVAPKDACVGDIAVWKRDGGAHVAIIVGEDKNRLNFHILGGNQSDMVNIMRKSTMVGLLGVRRPAYLVKPAGARQVFLDPTGAISTNEA